MKTSTVLVASLAWAFVAFPAPPRASADGTPPAMDGAPPAMDGTPPADAAAQVKVAQADLDTAVKAKDDGAVATAAKKLGGLFGATTDAAVKGSIAKDLCQVVKQAKLPSGRKAALEALVATDDGATAWKSGLAGLYPNNDADDPEKFNLEIVGAVGALHPEGAIDTLIETFRKGKQADLAAKAVSALGNYHKSKWREQILEEIYKAGKNMVPSRAPGKNPSAEAMARWGAIGQAIGKALDTLTGTSMGNPEEWFKKIDEAKKQYKGLFKD